MTNNKESKLLISGEAGSMTVARSFDLNADLGEGCANDAALLAIVTSANIACGAHAGDADTMRRTVDEAIANNVAIGAHPGYADRENFGRRRIPMTEAQIEDLIGTQTITLVEIARGAGARVTYVKPHGALANVAAEDAGVADAIARATQRVDPSLALLAMPGSQLEAAAHRQGVAVVRELYADRGYTEAGMLVSRSLPGALIDDEEAAVARLRNYMRTGRMTTASGNSIVLPADSICVHGDTPHAVGVARQLRAMLQDEGCEVRSFSLRI